MKKTVTISIAKTPFTIEEDAFEKLETYLASIRTHFADNTDAAEILKDIESRIAERLSENGSRIIQATEVERIVADMGTVSQFESSEEHPHTSPAIHKKQLYRDPDSGMIAGVASGLAHYFGVNTLLVRAVFIIGMLLSGVTLLIYIVLWIVIPQAKTAAQKLEMRGDPVTLSTVSAAVKEKLEEMKSDIHSDAPVRFSKEVSEAFSRLHTAIGPRVLLVFRIIFGSVFTLIGFFGSAAIMIAAGMLVTGTPTWIMFSPFAAYLSGPLLVLSALAALGIAFVPILAIFLIGISLLQKKLRIGKVTVTILFSLWFIAIVAAGISLASLFDHSRDMKTIRIDNTGYFFQNTVY